MESHGYGLGSPILFHFAVLIHGDYRPFLHIEFQFHHDAAVFGTDPF